MKRKRLDSSVSNNSNSNESISNKILRLQIGTNVQAQLDVNKWFTGTILQCELRKYLIQFPHLNSEDNQHWIDFENIRSIPKEKRSGTSLRHSTAFEYRPGQFIRNDIKTRNVPLPIDIQSTSRLTTTLDRRTSIQSNSNFSSSENNGNAKDSDKPKKKTSSSTRTSFVWKPNTNIGPKSSIPITTVSSLSMHRTAVVSSESSVSSSETVKSVLLPQRSRIIGKKKQYFRTSSTSSKESIEFSQQSRPSPILKKLEYEQKNPVDDEEMYHVPSECISLPNENQTKKFTERSLSNEKASATKSDQSEIVIFRPIIRFLEKKSRALPLSISQSESRPKRPSRSKRVGSKLSIDLSSPLLPTRHSTVNEEKKMISIHHEKEQEKDEKTRKSFAVQEEVVSSTSQQELSPPSISIEQDDTVSQNLSESDQHLFHSDEDNGGIEVVGNFNDEELPSTTTTISQSHNYTFDENDLIYQTDSNLSRSTDTPYIVHQFEGTITSSTTNNGLIDETLSFPQIDDKIKTKSVTPLCIKDIALSPSHDDQNLENLSFRPQSDRQKSKRKQHRPKRVIENIKLQPSEKEQVSTISIDKAVQPLQKQGKQIGGVLDKLRQKQTERKQPRSSTRKLSNKSSPVKLESVDVHVQAPLSIPPSPPSNEMKEELPVQSTSSFNWGLKISPKHRQHSKTEMFNSSALKNNMTEEQTNQSESLTDEHTYLSDEYEDPEIWVVDYPHSLSSINNNILKNNLIHPTQIQLTRVELKQILNRLQNIHMTLQEKVSTDTIVSPSSSDGEEGEQLRQGESPIETDFFDQESFMLTKYLKHVDIWLKNDFERYDLLETYRKMVYSDNNNDNSNNMTDRTFVERLHLLGEILKFIFCVFFKSSTEQKTYTKYSMKSFKQHINHMPDEIKYHIKTYLKQIIEINRQQQKQHETIVQNNDEKLNSSTFASGPCSLATSVTGRSKRSLNLNSKLSTARSKQKTTTPSLTVPPITIRKQRLLAPKPSTQLESKLNSPLVMNVTESQRSPLAAESSTSPLQFSDTSNSEVPLAEDDMSLFRTTKTKRQIKIRKPAAFLNTNEQSKSQVSPPLQTNSSVEISPLEVNNQKDNSALSSDINEYVSPKISSPSPAAIKEIDSALPIPVETITELPTTTVAAVQSPDYVLFTEDNADNAITDLIIEEPQKQHKEERDIYEVIHCICGIEIDNGLMIQCETCLCWSHCECVGVTETYVPAVFKCSVCAKSQSERAHQWILDSIDNDDSCSLLTSTETSNKMSDYFDYIKRLYNIREQIMDLKFTYQPILKCLHNALRSDDLLEIFRYSNIRNEHINEQIEQRKDNKIFYENIAICLNNIIECVCTEINDKKISATNDIVYFVDHLSTSHSSSLCVSLDLCPNEKKIENDNQQDMFNLSENLRLLIVYLCDDSETRLARLNLKKRYNDLLINLQDKIQISLDEHKDIQQQIETELGILSDDNDNEENDIKMLQTMYTNHENDLKMLIERSKCFIKL